jgi:protein SCO1
MVKKIQFGLIVLTLGIAIIWVMNSANQPIRLNGAVIEPAKPAYQFSLTYPEGQFNLSDTKGKVVLIFFGYTNCPDFCPNTLIDFRKVQEELGESANEVEFLFISIDPERDTPDSIWAYTQAFNPSFYGLSGTEEELTPIWDNYWVFREKDPASTGENYLMQHSVRIIVIDTFGNFRMTFPNGMDPSAITSDILSLITEAN